MGKTGSGSPARSRSWKMIWSRTPQTGPPHCLITSRCKLDHDCEGIVCKHVACSNSNNDKTMSIFELYERARFQRRTDKDVGYLTTTSCICQPHRLRSRCHIKPL